MRFIYILISIFLFFNSYSQAGLKRHLTKDTLLFEVQITSIQFAPQNRIVPSTIHIKVDSSAYSLVALIKKTSPAKVLELLKQDSFAWKVNILLYHIFKRNAGLYLGYKIFEEIDWRNSFIKVDDLNYWQAKLSSIDTW